MSGALHIHFYPAKGIALMMTLFMVAALSVILVGFVTIVKVDRSSSHHYSQGLRVDQVVSGGLQYVVDQLHSEITYSTNSDIYTSQGISVYVPHQSRNGVISRSGLNPNSDSLVKISKADIPFFLGGKSVASPVNSALNPALNGREVSSRRWSKPRLIESDFPAPDWINFTRNGPKNVPLAEAKDASLGNQDFVLGRFAFVVYDLGGLVDITVAGYPSVGSDLSSSDIARKGSPGLIDLTQIPNGGGTLNQGNVNELIQWRNHETLSHSYTNYLFNIAATNGFLLVQPGDETFVSRQSLIDYAQKNGIEKSLPYFTTFSREVNAPTWGPVTPANSLIDYSTLALKTSSTNRLLANVRALDG
ncbi:MAG: hypothetical protein V4507_15745, partial [Verrucomicrobiota bacterium]